MSGFFKPYVYQQDCLDALALTRAEGQRKALVVMATGLGKTVVSAFEIKRLLLEAPGRVLYLCHDNRILRQSRKTYEKILGKSHTYGYFHGTEKHMHHVDVLFASFQTMANWREAFLRDEFRYIVVDEFHHAQAATFYPTIEYFEPEFMLGLTATPERGDGLDVTRVLGDPVYNTGLFKALALSYLCHVDYRVMTDEIQNAGVLDTPVGKLSIAKLNRTIFIPKRDEEIARVIGEKMAEVESPRAMIFCASIAHAGRMAALMPHAVVIHSKLKENIKNERLEAFSTGEVSTILTVDMLNEGIDVPEANVIVFLRSTASRRIFLQQLGRGLRKAAGKLAVLVLDFVANCERFEMIDQLQKGVEAEYKRLVERDTESAAEAEPRTTALQPHFNLTLDGGEFDERLWRVFDVIRQAREDYTTEELATQLIEKATQLGRAPTTTEIDTDPSIASSTTFTTVFGMPWNDILRHLGLQVNRRHGDYTIVELEQQLLGKAATLRRAPTSREVKADSAMASVSVFRRAFGNVTWNEVLRKVGLEVNVEKPQARLTIPVLRDQLLAKAAALGRTPTSPEVDSDPNMASVRTFKAVFGTTWNGVIETIGLKPNASKRRPKG